MKGQASEIKGDPGAKATAQDPVIKLTPMAEDSHMGLHPILKELCTLPTDVQRRIRELN
jgi:hypothetical protein